MGRFKIIVLDLELKNGKVSSNFPSFQWRQDTVEL